MESTIPFDSQSESPLYEQIYQCIKNRIHQGRLEFGSRLPPTRVLTKNLGLGHSATQMAYDQLLSEEYTEAPPCKGYFVCKIEEPVETRQKGGGSFAEPGDTGKGHYEAGFSSRGADLSSFPFNTQRKISRNTLVDNNKEVLAAGDPQGERTLRIAIGDYLHSARGVDCRPEQILIGVGSEYSLAFLFQILGNGRKIAMENPTRKQVYRVLKGKGYLVIPVDMDRYGMNAQRFSRSNADVAYVTPSYQHPTGVVIPVKRRQELLAWAYSSADRYLIENGYDSELRYEGKPIPALQGVGQGGRVIYMGTFSKSIVPAIRMGFMVLSEYLLKAYRERTGLYLSMMFRTDQNILYQFTTQGHYERRLDRMKVLYKGKHNALMAGLKELEDWFLIREEYARLYVSLTHRQGETEESPVTRAAELGVKVYGVSGCFMQLGEKLFDSTVILGYASLSEEEV